LKADEADRTVQRTKQDAFNARQAAEDISDR